MQKFRRRKSLLRRRPYLNGRWHKVYAKKGRREFERFDLVLWLPQDLTATILEKTPSISGFSCYQIKAAPTGAIFPTYGNELLLLQHQPLQRKRRKQHHDKNHGNIRTTTATAIPGARGHHNTGIGASPSVERKSQLRAHQPDAADSPRNKPGKGKGTGNRRRKADTKKRSVVAKRLGTANRLGQGSARKLTNGNNQVAILSKKPPR